MNYVNLVIDHKSRYTDELYTYGSSIPLEIGTRVVVTFGRGKTEKYAYVFEENLEPKIEKSKIKEIIRIDETLSLTKEMVDTIKWMRQRYGIKFIEGIRCFVPSGKPASKGKEKEPYKSLVVKDEPEKILTEEQNIALDEIYKGIDENIFRGFLLWGVTGSGKTEVYIKSIEKVLKLGKTAIMLVPEITLTKQVIERFISRFGKSAIAVLHSKLTTRERYDEWIRIRKGEAKIVIGARAGIFAPVENLGIVILDEEHESTYKSDQTPKYETVDIAVKRLMINKGTLILGSATPSVVSFQRAKEGIYQLLEMKDRYNKVPLPSIDIVDMKKELKFGNDTMFSNRLYLEIKHTLEKGEQVILFLNRRGYSTFISCINCGSGLKCPDCNISLVYHKHDSSAVCHYCGKRFSIPDKCPSCGGNEFRYFGIGTEQVEEFTKETFPEYEVERLDLDTGKSKREINRIINNFGSGKSRILIGTQIVAKGLDFKNVGLVGVISADVSLNIPDYRSAERTFQLVTQVSGRAGRGNKQGKVIVQSFSPENFALVAAAKYDYLDFFKQEIRLRNYMNYPPFSDLICVEFTSIKEELAQQIANSCLNYLKGSELEGSENIFSPKLSESFRNSDSYRYHILIKCPRGHRNNYIHYIRFFRKQIINNKVDCVITIDVNPYSAF